MMKRSAFYLVASVVMVQMLMAAGVLFGCFTKPSPHCTGDKASDLLNNIIIQTFALYAAEKASHAKREPE